MNLLTTLLTRFRLSIWTVLLTGTLLFTATFSPASAIGAPLHSLQLTIGKPSLLAINSQTKPLLHVDEAKFAKAPVEKPISSEKARGILLDQPNLAGVTPPPVKSESSEKTITTFLHLNPAVASKPEPSIPLKLEVLKEKLTKRGVEVPAKPSAVVNPVQPVAKSGYPASESFDKVSDVLKGLFKDSDD